MSAQQQMLVGGQASDPYWSFVQLLVGCNSLAGVNTFNSEVPTYAFVNTTVADPLTTPAISGLACSPSAGNRCITSDADGWALRTNIGSGEFTLEGWFRRTGSITGDGTFFQWGSSDMLTIRCTTSTNVYMQWNINSGTSGDNVTFTSLDTWMHWALARDSSNNLRWFVGGTLEQTWPATGGAFTLNSFAGGGIMALGGKGAGSGNYTVGCTDEIRFTTKCRYTANFTPVQAPWPRG